MSSFWLAQTDGSVRNRLFGSADSFLENRTDGSVKPIIRSDTRTLKISNLVEALESWNFSQPGYSKKDENDVIIENKSYYIDRNVTLNSHATFDFILCY